MSKIFSAVLAMAAAACLAAPAQARIDTGPISSLYEKDGRATAKRPSKQRASKATAKKRYGKKQYSKKAYRGTKTAHRKSKSNAGRQHSRCGFQRVALVERRIR